MKINKVTSIEQLEILKNMLKICFDEEIIDKSKWDKLLKNQQYSIWIAYLDEKPVGFIGMMSVCTLQYEAFWVDLIGVLPEYRNRGIARKMIEFGKKSVKKSNPDFISALIADENISSQKAFQNSKFEKDKKFHLFFSDCNS